MRSGTGRHRRPRQAPAIVVAAGVTGAGIAMPLFGAAGAQAAPTTTWDRVAECESGNMWSANEGNGFYGGLQLTLDMWKQYGGTEYAPRPDLASRHQQITVAESILEDRGPDAWPSCALNAGLSLGGDAPEVDPGSTRAPSTGQRGDVGQDGESDDSPASTAPDASDVSEPDGKDGKGEERETGDRSDEAEEPETSETSESPDAEDSTPSSSPSSSDPTADPAPTGRHRGEQGPEEASDGGSADQRPSGRHASRGGDTDRTASPEGDDYTVRPGDSLSGIAQRQELSDGWHGLYETNEPLIGEDPDLILPGQRLDLSVKEQ